MIVNVPVPFVKSIAPRNEVASKEARYKNDNQRVNLDLRHLTTAEADKLIDLAKTKKGVGWKTIITSVETYRLMRADPSGAPVPNLKALATALVEYFRPTPNKWAFKGKHEHRLPYFVKSVKFIPAKTEDRQTTPAYVRLEMEAAEERYGTVHFHDDFGKGLSVPEILTRVSIAAENKELLARYEAEMEKYKLVSAEIGAQYTATGYGRSMGERWYRGGHQEMAMEREGSRSKVVIDDGSENKEDRERNKSDTSSKKFWRKGTDDDGGCRGRETVEEEDVVTLPSHPWVDVFDLTNQQFVQCHVNDLEPYQYDETLADKLVLPEDTMDCLYALIRGADEVMEDIVEGKTGGTIVIATGPPGTGKTLTAELFSEIAKKPLYTVQCSQLGVEPEALEKELGIVLSRASRWKALLLIDEADVYIRSRGDDIQQNAIVGIWLRVLEYYRGILFMTSNKATIIDDAVMSRATAWVRYERPTLPELARIWTVLGTQYEVPLDPALIDELLARWPNLTGRNVKNMLKLAKQLAKTRRNKSQIDLFERVATFLDVPRLRHNLDDNGELPDQVDVDELLRTKLMAAVEKLLKGS